MKPYEKFQAQLTENPVRWVVQGWGTLGVDAAGDFGPGVTAKGSVDGDTWTELRAVNGATSMEEEGHYRYDVSGYAMIEFAAASPASVTLTGLGV